MTTLNAALAARHVTADAVIAIDDHPADPLQIGSGNRAKHRFIDEPVPRQ